MLNFLLQRREHKWLLLLTQVQDILELMEILRCHMEEMLIACTRFKEVLTVVFKMDLVMFFMVHMTSTKLVPTDKYQLYGLNRASGHIFKFGTLDLNISFF